MSAANKTWLARYWPLLTVLGLGLGVSAWLGVSEHRQGQRLDEQRFNIEARQAVALLGANLARHEERLMRFADHCAQFDELPLAVWRFQTIDVTELSTDLRAVMLAVYCPKISATDFKAHAERGRTVWADNYHFEPERNGRSLALPVWQQWARAGIEPVPLGTDFGVATEQRPSFAPALINLPTWSDVRPTRVQRKDGRTVNGVWFGIPLFAVEQGSPRARRATETAAQFAERGRNFRRAAAKGVLAVFLSADQMVDLGYNHPGQPSRLHVRVYTHRETQPDMLVNPATQPPPNPRHRRTIVLPWEGKRWCIEMVSTPLFEAESTGRRAWPIGLGGAGFTLLAATLMGVSIRARVRQELLTAEITEARNTLAATERERASLGDDLHDGAIQSLYAIQLGMTRTARDVADALPGAARVLDETRHRVDVVIAELRRFIHAAARGPADEVPSLEHVLASVVQSLRATTLAELTLETQTGAAEPLTSAQSVALAQLARSALGNALRHAEAKQISVRLMGDSEGVVLTVQDNGKGFVVAECEGAGEGIRSMRQRATAARGVLRIESMPGHGTRVEVRLRFADATQPHDTAPASHAKS